jgi:hypothetical protein
MINTNANINISKRLGKRPSLVDLRGLVLDIMLVSDRVPLC